MDGTLAFEVPEPGVGDDTLPAGDAVDTAETRAGTVLADRYRLVRCIKRGGMGSVWEGVHTGLDTAVAIKLIDPRLAGDEKARDRFVREARSAAALRGRNVVQILDYGVHDDTPYIAMELLHGESLAERLMRVGMLTPRATLAILEDVCRAIAKAHESEMVHRDLKPDNIFLCEADDDEPYAKVLDFGIVKGVARELEVTTSVGAIIGTPHYMSPEQLMDAAQCDARSDLWSLGVITYECLLGRRPFQADSLPELAVAVLAFAPPVPSDAGKVPAGFDAWFQRATARDAAERFQSTAELIDALRDVLRDDVKAAVVVVPPASPRRSWAWPLGIAAAIGVGAFVVAGGRRHEEPTASKIDAPAVVEPSRDPSPKPTAAEPPSEVAPTLAPAEPEPTKVEPQRDAEPPTPPVDDAGEDDADGKRKRKRKTTPPSPTEATEPKPTEAKGFDISELEEP